MREGVGGVGGKDLIEGEDYPIRPEEKHPQRGEYSSSYHLLKLLENDQRDCCSYISKGIGNNSVSMSVCVFIDVCVCARA